MATASVLHASPVDGGSNGGGGYGDPRGPRRVRKSKPKVKTGCNNCKLRRIKCDEQRPACTQCVRSKKQCTGYPPPPRPHISQVKPIAPKPSSQADQTLAIAPTRPRIQPVSQLYANAPAPLRTTALTPPMSPEYMSLILRQPSAIPFDSSEGQYFQLFRDYTASELSGFFDSSFWTKRVLQECHSEDSIRHAVVALGALYKTLEKMSESPPGSPSGPSGPSGTSQLDNAQRHQEVAFKHYSLAIKAVVNSGSHDQAKKRMSLMASVLLACFDSFIGDHKQAIQQIQSGLRLLETLRDERRRANLPRPEEPVEQDLIQMFTRLVIQAKSYDMAFHFPQPYVIRLTPKAGETAPPSSTNGGPPVSTNRGRIPEAFTSLHDGRLAWDTLCENIMRFTEHMSTFVRVSPMHILPLELKQYGKEFDDQMEAWSRAFDPILTSRMAPAKSTQEKTAIAVLKMNQTMGCILFKMTFSDSESQFDQFLPLFRDIVNLAMEVIGDEERRAAAKRCPNPDFCQHHQFTHPDAFGGEYTARHIKPSFSADLGIVPPLFVVATKCRDPLTRQQAIQLLRTSARREGMWDSELCARIGSWIATVEEEDDGVDDTPRPVSSSTEASRLSIGSPGSMSNGSPAFGEDLPLGPGGNARWGSRRESSPLSPQMRTENTWVPERKRVMVRAVEFDLQKRIAVLQCGTRGLIPGMPDLRTRATKIVW
ncbi:putative C6 zinc finger domain-containing protein [Rosellinia necatrix]|uniref:Putative C6 zinc finger domain-containing protein n=1 Tax=Rosellinia necatrix TaxID=77044 RepID=A0A1S7UM66_ROSNE|nr:putative C6 zinc finger domain-containing protein [Rosellinia necatrix]